MAYMAYQRYPCEIADRSHQSMLLKPKELMAFLSLQPRGGVLGSDVLYHVMEITLSALLTAHVRVKLECSVTLALPAPGTVRFGDLLKKKKRRKIIIHIT